jgi:hypothetical protein
MSKQKHFSSQDIMQADFAYQKKAMPLVQQFKEAAKTHQAYCINPDGSVQFDLEAWDGR